eukprot:Gb_37793 [translate_table: standard]
MSTSQTSVEIPIEGGDHTEVDPGLSIDPPLISNTPDFISPSTVIHEHQVINDLVDPVVPVSIGDHTDATHSAIEVVPSQASILDIGVIPETPLSLNDPVCVEIVTGPLEGHNIHAYDLF